MRSKFGLLCLLAAASAITAQPSQRHVITRIEGDSGQHYEVVSGPCIARKCSIAVELFAAGRSISLHSLGISSSSPDFEQTELQEADGFGDPSMPKHGFKVWQSGDDDDKTVLSITQFLLQPGLTGILIDEREGFEHLKRHHVLLAARQNRLVELWHGSEGAGPTFSTVIPVAVSEGREALLFYSFFDYPDDTQSDKIMLKSLIYNSVSDSMVRYSQPLTALVLGPFATVAAARKERSSHKSCAGALRVFPATGFQKTARGYVLSTITSSNENVSALQAHLKSCNFNYNVSLIPMKQDEINLW